MPTTVSMWKQINAPPDRVFDLASDFPTMAGRISTIKKIEMLTDGPVRVGTRFKETRVVFGKEATETMQVTDLDPPRSYSLQAISCGCRYDSRLDVKPSGAGSMVSLSFTATPISFFAKLMSPLAGLMKGMMRKCFEADLESLRQAAEKPESS